MSGAETIAPASAAPAGASNGLGQHRNGAAASNSSLPAAPITRTIEERFWLFPYVQPNSDWFRRSSLSPGPQVLPSAP